MSDLSSVDVELDRARAAVDSGIDGVLAAVQSALEGIKAQIERLETLHEELESKRQSVEAEIDALADRAAQLEGLALPGPVAEHVVHDDEDGEYVDEDTEVLEVIEYVDEDGNPVDEHGNPIEYVDEDGNPLDGTGAPIEYVDADVEYVEELALDEAPWADLEVARTERLVTLVESRGELTTAEAVEALAEVGDDVSTSTVSASLGNLARQGRITKLDAGVFGPA